MIKQINDRKYMAIYLCRRFVFIVILFPVNSWIYSQNLEDCSGKANPLLVNGIIQKYEPKYPLSTPSGFVGIESVCDELFAVESGTIIKIKVDVPETILLIQKDSVIYAYGNLSFVCKKVGDQINTGELLGIVKNGDENKFIVYFGIFSRS